MAQTFRQRIAQAEAMARADILKFQPEVIAITIANIYAIHIVIPLTLSTKFDNSFFFNTSHSSNRFSIKAIIYLLI